MSFDPIPAIDVREGRVVRLQQGDYARETRYADEPAELAERYAKGGARWLHLVDLDAAKAGGYTLHGLLRRLKSETGLQIQTGGGVRSEADVEALLASGADRVVIGSLAVRSADRVAGWIERFGADRMLVALDTRLDEGEWTLPVHGWTESSNWTLPAALLFYRDRGLRHLLSTDIDRDGMLAGPNPDLYRLIRERAPELAVQASGGVREVADVTLARDIGCAGIVLGRALLEQRITLQDALAEAR